MSQHRPENAESHADRKARYEALLDTIAHNTGGPEQANPQPAGIRRCHVATVMVGNGPRWTAEDFSKAFRAAIENDDVIRYPGPDGHRRYTLRDERHAEAAYREEAQREHPDEELVGWLYEVLQDLRGDD